MTWYDGEVEVRHYFHQDTNPQVISTPPDGAVIIFQYVVHQGRTVTKLVPTLGNATPMTVYVPQVEIHYVWTTNPDNL